MAWYQHLNRSHPNMEVELLNVMMIYSIPGNSCGCWPYWLHLGSQERLSHSLQDHLHACTKQGHGQPFSQHLNRRHCANSHRQVQIILSLHWKSGRASGDFVPGKVLQLTEEQHLKVLLPQLTLWMIFLHFALKLESNAIYKCQFGQSFPQSKMNSLQITKCFLL